MENIFFLTGRERKNFPEMKSRGKIHRLEHAISDPVPIGSGYETDAKPNHQPSGLSRQTMKVRKDPTLSFFPYPDENGQEQRWIAPNKETIKGFWWEQADLKGQRKETRKQLESIKNGNGARRNHKTTWSLKRRKPKEWLQAVHKQENKRNQELPKRTRATKLPKFGQSS